MKSHLTLVCVTSIATVLAVACSKEAEEVEAPKFDATFIAAEADKGNLAPLQELNKACSEEVQIKGKRLTVCKIQDDVGKLAKPLSIRF